MVGTLYPLAPKGSPRKLNWLGHEIIKLIDGISFLKDNKDYFFDLMDKEDLQTAYDVEKSAYSVCFLSTQKEIFFHINDTVYQASTIKVQTKIGDKVDFIVDIFNACTVLSIPLRDMYLEEHPGLLEFGALRHWLRPAVTDGWTSSPTSKSKCRDRAEIRLPRSLSRA